eukprot:6890812-Pyramimonas_sp.AAC.1
MSARPPPPIRQPACPHLLPDCPGSRSQNAGVGTAAPAQPAQTRSSFIWPVARMEEGDLILA